MKKIICLIIILTMLVCIAACAKTPENDNDTDTEKGSNVTEGSNNPDDAVTTSAFETVELMDFNKHTFRILYSQTDSCYYDFLATEMNGSYLNDDVYKRNSLVEDALNIKIEIDWKSYTDVNTTIQNHVASGVSDYDMYGGHRSSLAHSYAGYLYDFSEVEQIDLGSEWWDQDWVSSMSFDDSIYALVGDISVSCQLFVSSLCFNKVLFDSNGFDYPYEAVRNKTWTYDLLLQYIDNYTSDTNGDGAVTWESDRYGLTGWGTEAGYSLFYASGFNFITKSSNDTMQININADRLIQIVDKVLAVWVGADSYFNNSGSSGQHAQPFSIFAEDRALFCDIVLSKIGTFISDMPSDYGIVPQPMFDVNQGRYYSYTGYSIPITMVPSNCPNITRTGTIIEALCTASYDGVIPDMYEIVTSVKNARDGDSSEMIAIIIRTKLFDPAHWYNVSGYGTFSRNIIAGGVNNVSSTLGSFTRAAEINLKTITDAFDKLQNK